jgi:hypothetical protein
MLAPVMLEFLICGSLGCLLISWSAFLYETEERQIGDALATWWVVLEDMSQSSVSRSVVFINRLSLTITSWLDSVFGENLLSSRAIAASICLSTSAFLLLGAVALIAVHMYEWPAMSVVLLLAAIAFVAAVTARFRFLRYVVSSLTCVAIILMIASPILQLDRGGVFNAGTQLGFALAAGILADIGVIVGTRYLARRGAVAQRSKWPVITAIACAALAFIVFAAPLMIARLPGVDKWWVGALAIFGLTNLYAAIIAASFVMLAISFVLHRLLWPIINRPLYAMHRFRIFEKRKLLFFAGVTLLAIATPRSVEVLDRIARILLR